MRGIWAIVASVVGLVSVARAAQPDPELERARVHMQAGVAYYDEARYDDAAREIEAAYRIKPVGELQYNLAQCYERLGRADDAAAAYKRYLDEKPGADDRAMVELRIQNLKLRAVIAPPAEKVVFKTIVIYKEKPPPPGRAARWAGYGVAVLGVAALASGIATAVLTQQSADQVSSGANLNSPPPFDGGPRDAQNRGKTMQTIAGVSFGVAALAAGGAVGLFLLGRKIDGETKVAVAPFVGAGGGGVVAAWRF